MEARLGVAQRIRAALESVPADHAAVRRRYLQTKWANSPNDVDFDVREDGGDETQSGE